TQAVEYLDVQQLAADVGHEAGQGNAQHEAVELAEGVKAAEGTLLEEYRYHIGHQQCRQHDPGDDPAGGLFAEQAYGQVAGQKDEGKAEGTPGGMRSEERRVGKECSARGSGYG